MGDERSSDGTDFSTLARPATADHLLSRKKPNRKSVLIALDSDLADAYDEAKLRNERAETNMKFRPDDEDALVEFNAAADHLLATETELKANSIEFVFRSIGRKRYEDLMLEHRPTAEHQKRAKAQGDGEYGFNPDTFPPVLIAESLESPVMTPEQFQKEIWDNDDWNNNETLTLFSAAMDANSGRRVVDFPKDSRRTSSSGLSLTTASPGGSPTARSSNGQRQTKKKP